MIPKRNNLHPSIIGIRDLKGFYICEEYIRDMNVRTTMMNQYDW
jgi:hypothetical protein